jgi:hypothetical protein
MLRTNEKVEVVGHETDRHDQDRMPGGFVVHEANEVSVMVFVEEDVGAIPPRL